MCTKNIPPCVLALATAVGLAGCIAPTTFDPTLMHQYQRYVEQAGPQARMAESLVRQVPGTTGLPLKSVIDEQTGRTNIPLTIDEAVRRALSNNTAITVVGHDPAIAREDIVIAEAEFDAIVTSSVGVVKTDTRTQVIGQDSQSKTYAFEAAIGQRLPTGGEVQVSFQIERQRTRGATALVFDPAYTTRGAVQLTHPLLRNAGPYVTQSRIRVAKLNHDISLDAFRSTVLQVVSETQSLYWQLKRAREELAITEQLLHRSELTLEYVTARSNLDASRVQITDAQATVATNRLNVIQARKAIRDVQDRLVRIMADASITLLDDYDILPITPFSTDKRIVDPADQVAAALRYNPDLAQARTAIAIQDVNVRVARNQVLPSLDLSAGAAANGVEATGGRAWNQMMGADFLDYNVTLAFEWPIANRARAANLRKARYGRAKSIATLQDTADQVAVAVNDAIRAIDTSYEGIQASLVALAANLSNLDALESRREYRQALTPDFLNRLLAAQENVARTEQTLLTTKVNYNTAQASLAQITGTSLQDMGVLITDVEDDVLRLLMSRAQLTGRPPVGAPAATEE